MTMVTPLAYIIEQPREVLIWGRLPDLAGSSIDTLTSTFMSWTGFVWFEKDRTGYADVH